MNKASLIENISYQENQSPTVTVLLKTPSTKELRILMKKGQFMKEHKAPYPIVIELFEGEVDFGIKGEKQLLKRGDMIALEANVPHDLDCISDCIVRLSISVLDTVERVNKVSQ
ncbi:cupin domain-containing protein [Zobellia uliginosa]|uniref:cupin domain-containing protein n=1 Tax=Zobellia uliginosa TaxID=143224 RepID=UPI0026E1912A|nr:cupin domain-containing protein [Zobellia uliginosa]MDO6516697.1 cupin domain-containing protein [Zobellia uliginosa]